jgi:hypothetical protein
VDGCCRGLFCCTIQCDWRNNGNLRQDRGSPGRDSKPAAPESEGGLLRIAHKRSTKLQSQ